MDLTPISDKKIADAALVEDPALIFLAPGHIGPGTHVLIVGISAYPHLIGGKKPRPDIAEGMGQLDAPAISARALAAWFLDEFNNPDRPLASLALLLSEPSPVTFAHVKSQRAASLPRGTIGDLSYAIDRWVRRASSERENQVIFFFSGHGVSSGESILLLRDFGNLRNNRFDGSLNLSNFVNAMQTMVPEYQLFLIDACRVPTSLANLAMGQVHLGRPCLTPNELDERSGKPAKQSVHHASSSLSPAYGRVRGASLYTEALLKALSGGGAQSNIRWWVGTLGLQAALSDYTQRSAAHERVEQQPELVKSSQFTVHKPRAIEIPVYITTEPPDALSKVRRVEFRLGSAVRDFYDPAKHGVRTEWACVLPLREHQLAASFPQAAEYDDYIVDLNLSTPSTWYEIPVSRRP
jgi:hypothetical protein